MESQLEKLYFKFLKFHQKNFIKDRKFWFGVKKAKIKENEIEKVFLNYEIDTFYEFCRRIKDIIFSKEPLIEIQRKWSTDAWLPFYYFDFLRREKILDFKKGGTIILKEKKFLNFFPKIKNKNEIKKKLEKKLKMKLPLKAPANFPFKTKVKAKYDQFPISISSAIFLVSKILEYLPLYKKFLFLGDDDLISIYLSLTDEKIESVVIDIDRDLLKKIEKISKKFNLKIKTLRGNVLEKKKINEDFVGFLTNPVYTFEGAKTFLNFGKTQLSEKGGFVFLVFSDEGIGNRYLHLQKFFSKVGFKIEEVIKGKIFYPWKIVHFEDKIIERRYKKIVKEKVIKNSPIISSSLWIFSYIPFKIPPPKKQLFYAYL